MTVKEIKDIICSNIDFYSVEMTFAVTDEEYREFLGAQKALTCLLHEIEKIEEKENGKQKNS